MKHISLLLFICAFSILLCGCTGNLDFANKWTEETASIHSSATEAATESPTENPDQTDVFIRKVQGIWGAKPPQSSFEFMRFEDSTCFSGEYRGMSYPSCEITSAILESPNSYRVTFYFPEYYDTVNEEYYEESTSTCLITFPDHQTFVISRDDGVRLTYAYYGDSFETAEKNFEKLESN